MFACLLDGGCHLLMIGNTTFWYVGVMRDVIMPPIWLSDGRRTHCSLLSKSCRACSAVHPWPLLGLDTLLLFHFTFSVSMGNVCSLVSCSERVMKVHCDVALNMNRMYWARESMRGREETARGCLLHKYWRCDGQTRHWPQTPCFRRCVKRIPGIGCVIRRLKGRFTKVTIQMLPTFPRTEQKSSL